MIDAASSMTWAVSGMGASASRNWAATVGQLRDRGLIHASFSGRTERYDHKLVGTFMLDRREQHAARPAGRIADRHDRATARQQFAVWLHQ